jgi:hypothetical protein
VKRPKHLQNKRQLNVTAPISNFGKITTVIIRYLIHHNYSIEDKWTTIFKNKNLRYIKKLVSALLSISASNAFCESVFSIVGNVWDAERNSFKPDTVNSIVYIKMNAEFDCSQALELYLSNSDLLKLAKGNQKCLNL